MRVKLLKFYPFETSLRRPRLLGYADVEIEESIVIRQIKLFESRHGGYFIQLPEMQKEGKSFPIVEAKTRETLESIRRVIVDYYKSALSSGG